ncbi:MAG TPA: histidine phosphatase family protein [Acidimicrobiia bacterium]|nr:histidine phosphatase family protein [Acidimicrobiia bacterium]
MPEILLIRHAESETNREGLWSGRADGPLSPAGMASLDQLAGRFSGQRFDLVVSSPLQRAVDTAAAISPDVEISADFIEIDIGRWEGMTREEVLAADDRLPGNPVLDRDLALGMTGERLDDAELRAFLAIEELATRLGERGRAVVVTHGGLLNAVLHRYLPGRRRRVHVFAGNTSVTRLVWSHDRARLASFNDTGHLGPRSAAVARHLAAGRPVLALIRHGQTRANIEGRWQGQGDWGLDERGHSQAAALRDWYGTADTVYSSPSGRAQGTADYLANNGVVTVVDLSELAMGQWEGLTSHEIMEHWPDRMESIFRDGVDLRRGEDGESWGELAHRFSNAVQSLEPARGEPTLVVAHGGAIRSYVSLLTATTDSHAESLYTPTNTSVTHIAIGDDGPVILDYGVATHLETLS